MKHINSVSNKLTTFIFILVSVFQSSCKSKVDNKIASNKKIFSIFIYAKNFSVSDSVAKIKLYIDNTPKIDSVVYFSKINYNNPAIIKVDSGRHLFKISFGQLKTDTILSIKYDESIFVNLNYAFALQQAKMSIGPPLIQRKNKISIYSTHRDKKNVID